MQLKYIIVDYNISFSVARLFPYDAMFHWLSYGNDPSSDRQGIKKDFFGRREWSFTMENDIYIRYQSFRDQGEMSRAIQTRQPHKIDIGAVFSAPPKDHLTVNSERFRTEERELVFDIDMTDYDDIRTCCTGAEICMRCWPYMTMAVKAVDVALREDFDFKHILWVYSGRRGVHCWVSDPEARSLVNEARAAIVEYLSVIIGSQDNSDKKLKQTFVDLHPMLQRAYDILDPMFEKYIADEKGQGLLAKKDRYVKILNSLPDENIRKELYDRWERPENQHLKGADRWRHIRAVTTNPQSAASSSSAAVVQTNSKKRRINYQELEAWRVELVFTHCYPRLDANVSKTQNHLLKSPFCVHPKTGRVCIPIDPREVEKFNPFTVPTVRSLCEEIDEYDRQHRREDGASVAASSTSANSFESSAASVMSGADDIDGPVSDIEKTSLKSSVDFFNRQFLRDLSLNNS